MGHHVGAGNEVLSSVGAMVLLYLEPSLYLLVSLSFQCLVLILSNLKNSL